MSSWKDLQELGWKQRSDKNNRVSFLRPDGSVVSQRRQLSEREKSDIGDILFPGKRRKVAQRHETLGTQSSSGTQSQLHVHHKVHY